MNMNVFLLATLSLALPSYGESPTSPTPLLAKPTRLIFDDDGSIDRSDKKPVAINDEAKVRAWVGGWHKYDGVWRTRWEAGMPHTPVMAYDIPATKNMVIEVTFRYGSMTEPRHTQCFRIALDNRKLYTGHVLSAWANPNNDFIETGLLLQHISKEPDKTIISDLLVDRQKLKIEPGKWYTATLEVVDDEALFRIGDHVAWGKLDKWAVEKIKISLTLGKTWHEVKRVRVWEAAAKPNPKWAKVKDEVLGNRAEFRPQKHAYVKPTTKAKK